MSFNYMREKFGFKKPASKDKARRSRSRERKRFKVHKPIAIPGLPDYQQKSFNLTKSGKFFVKKEKVQSFLDLKSMSDEELKQYFRVGCPLNFAGVQILVISAQLEREIFSGQPTKAH